MLKLYHSKGTRGFRVIWLCEELGIEYEVETVDFSAGMIFFSYQMKIFGLK